MMCMQAWNVRACTHAHMHTQTHIITDTHKQHLHTYTHFLSQPLQQQEDMDPPLEGAEGEAMLEAASVACLQCSHASVLLLQVGHGFAL